jgi:hypothetical protein
MGTSTFYIIKPMATIALFFKNPIAIAICLPVLVAPVISRPSKAILLLGFFLILDFITGIAANYFDVRKTSVKDDNIIKKYVIESSKLRLSIIKFITYGLALLIAYGIEWTFIADEFKTHLSIQKMTLTTIVTAFCCLIEVYSILFENIKRMGFDIIQKIEDIITKGWKLYKIFKGGQTE